MLLLLLLATGVVYVRCVLEVRVILIVLLHGSGDVQLVDLICSYVRCDHLLDYVLVRLMFKPYLAIIVFFSYQDLLELIVGLFG